VDGGVDAAVREPECAEAAGSAADNRVVVHLLPGGVELLVPSVPGQTEESLVQVALDRGRLDERVVRLPGKRGRESVPAEDRDQRRRQDEEEQARVEPLE